MEEEQYKGKGKPTKNYRVIFTDRGVFIRVLTRLGVEGVSDYLKKDLPNQSKAKIVVSSAKTLAFTYNVKKSALDVLAHYAVRNDHGYLQ